jgi:C-terminal processing protease CtpA/Prc
MPPPAGAWLDITVGEYYTPNGHNLGGGGVKEGKGITPNVYVNPNGKGPSALTVAEQTVAAEIH